LNKLQFIEYLKYPTQMSAKNLDELEEVINSYPYFQGARTILAKAKKEISPESAPKFIATAAVYATDRAFLKKYMSGQLVFLQAKDKPAVSPTPSPPEESAHPKSTDTEFIEQPAEKMELETPEKETQITTAELSLDNLTPPSSSALDELIKEIFQDIEDLKKSKARFREWERKNEEEEAVDSALKQVTERQTQKKVVETEQKTKPEDEKSKTDSEKPVESGLKTAIETPEEKLETPSATKAVIQSTAEKDEIESKAGSEEKKQDEKSSKSTAATSKKITKPKSTTKPKAKSVKTVSKTTEKKATSKLTR